MPDPRRPVLYLVACGGHAATELHNFVLVLHDQGWEVCVIATPSALGFIDSVRLEALTGHVVRSEYKEPGGPDVLPAPEAIAVVPATFNTINKWANGISDTLALGILNAAVGSGLPVIVVPTPNADLARHPAFIANVAALRSWGVRILFDTEKRPMPPPGTGLAATDFFSWETLESAVREIKPITKSGDAASDD